VRASFAPLDEVAITRAPSAFAIASVAVETPLSIPPSGPGSGSGASS
jgi:hypothetical protein